MAYSDYIGGERGERGERGRRSWGRGWSGGWPYYGYGYGGYPMLDVPSQRVLGPQYGYVILGQDPATGAPTATPVPPGTPGAVSLPSPQAPMQPPMPPQMQMAPMGPPPEMMFPFPPRGAVVAAPMPTQANRDILPMSIGVPILPTQSAQITGRPQTLVFKIGRFVISNAGTAGGAADWIVNDIKIGNRSQFVQSGDVPGDLFATNAIDTFVRFESAQTAMDVVVVVTYIGLNESGAPFFGAMVGTTAI